MTSFKLGSRSAAGVLLLGLLVGCDSYLDVENPASLLDEDLERPELLETLANTPEANIAGDLSGLNSRSGLLADEILHPSTQLENVDAMQGNRLASNSAVEGHWRGLAQSRWLSDEVATRLAAGVSDPGSNSDVARAHFFGGLARLSMADHFNVIVYDSEDMPRGPIDVIGDAITRFNSAATIANAGGDANLEAAALGQVARAQRSLYFEEMHLKGNIDMSFMAAAEAAARAALAARGDYNLGLRYGAPGGSNSAAQLGGPFGGVNRIDGTAYAFLPDPVTGDWDPRIPHVSLGGVAEETDDLGAGFGATAINLKFPDRESELPVSRAAEAMLIIAEARLLAGDLPEAVSWINQVRAEARARVSGGDWGGSGRGWPPMVSSVSDLQDLVSADADEIYAQLRHERRVEFFLELRRWPDMRYYEIVPDRWLSPNVAAGMHLRWPPAPEEIAQNSNLTLTLTQSVYVR